MIGRPLSPGDEDDLRALHQDERVARTLGGVYSHDQCDAWMRRMLAHWDAHGLGYRVWRDGNTGEFLGRGGLRHCFIEGEPVVEVGYAFAADHWGRGLATEMTRAVLDDAFAQLGIRRIVSFTLTTNLASQRVMQKSGLTYVRDVTHAALPHVLYEITRP
jgi:[ribosomal protein S5]-alanine N-acetyltransferase